ncbi:binding-protein-dependent transport systems inner membrane component [Haladaptatus paucihalophilus DX253]|uniref:Binding-protein-dependent transport systems inner membrane component n=1 Tax=Haladaptatus paucihalophilus DX253 TaxID=797209 RepID=E7QZE7_HALPU|nr:MULTISPECIES: carbohydrate ABC transporter permease [Haladaptatus]EFW90068.1 binding-protein-dependent transport systems inner membrane component [Haladaptatus paucihalophilus DX253]GKZ14501.1 ABC transporter permease [Haladaptatus sp. T7]SHL04279.1 carbohydrate ABC transporter membrane protein 2, CUT1 family [Haladaptatus paucihalophilus DX253]
MATKSPQSNSSFLNDPRLKTIGFHAFVWSLTLIVLFPIIWMVVTSLNVTTVEELTQIGITGWLSGVSLNNYMTMLNQTTFLTWFINSAIVSLASTLISIVVCIFGAYSIGRLRFRGRKVVATFLLITQMFPYVVIVIPLFLVFRDLGLFNTLTGLVIAYIAFTLPFTTWMLRGFYENLPAQLEEAAMVDGSTRIGAVISVILPLSAPAIATTFIFGWILAWNEFLFALVLINDPTKKTLPPGIGSWIGQNTVNWGLIMAGSTAVSLPLLLLFVFLQRYLVEGLAEGAVKS